MPVYNEEKNIGHLLEEAAEIFEKNNIDAEIIVVNDGSTDDTRRICEELSKMYRLIKLINHEVNRGYSQAVSTGVKQARNDYVILMDSDGQFDVKDISAFLKKYEQTGTDVIFGCRKDRKGSFPRRLMSIFMTWLSNILFGMKFKDTQCAFQFIKTDLLKGLDIESPSFQVPTEIKIKLSSIIGNYEQISVVHNERKGGRTAFKALKVIPPTILFLLKLRLKVSYLKRVVTDSRVSVSREEKSKIQSYVRLSACFVCGL